MRLRRQFKLRAFAAKLRGFLRGRRRDAEFEDEIQEHLQSLKERFVGQGMSSEEAAAAARRQFGNVTLLEEDRRKMLTLPWIEGLWQDLRYALRTLWKSRGFAVVSVATLGLGIGAATAIFSVVENVVLSPFPYKDARRMVFPRVHNTQQGQEGGRQGYTTTEFLEFAEGNHVFDGMTAASEDLVLYKHGEGTEQFDAARVTPGTFEFFGMPALYGRVMQPSDYEPGAPPVFVMRYKTWMERFNGDSSILNKIFVLSGTPRTLIGIMPPRFGWYGADVFLPEKPVRGAMAGATGEERYWFTLGHLKPGVSMQQAEADLTVIANHLARVYPQDYPPHFTVQVKKLGDTVVGRMEATLYTVLAAVGLLLMIACANVANLMLARATAREKEFALRTALGAGRARIVRLLMVESLVLAMGGAMLGVFLAWGGLKALVGAMPQDTIPSESVIELNAPVLAFTLCVAVLTALIFGLVPALQSFRRDLNEPVRDSGKGVSGGFRGKWLRDAVVVMEVALSLTLLIGAGLLMRSFVALREVRLGLRADHVFQTVLLLPEGRYKTAEQTTEFCRLLLARLKALPGVADATVSTAVPSRGGDESRMEIAGKTHGEEWQTLFQSVSEGYFRVLRVELREGRVFTDAEVNDARKVAVVNEAFSRKYLPNEDPIGQRVRLTRLETSAEPLRDAWFEITGVVADVSNRGLNAPVEPEIWIPHTIAGAGAQVLLVRTSQDPGTMMNAVQRAVWATDSGVPLGNSGTLERQISETLYAGPKFGFLLMTIFAGIGLILVTVGVYGVLAYSMARRTHEIGIRMALGAESRDVLGMVVRLGLRLVAVGMAIGIALSLALGRLIGTQLTGVSAYDPLTLAVTTLLLTLTAAVACWIPARKAARVDPMVALRYE
ncbi:MAG TPA: ABC transporter permease [Candidatus Acidoferrum sp.]|nr:ABC transporter permease [Candidatus Acidoferrum sp.]